MPVAAERTGWVRVHLTNAEPRLVRAPSFGAAAAKVAVRAGQIVRFEHAPEPADPIDRVEWGFNSTLPGSAT